MVKEFCLHTPLGSMDSIRVIFIRKGGPLQKSKTDHIDAKHYNIVSAYLFILLSTYSDCVYVCKYLFLKQHMYISLVQKQKNDIKRFLGCLFFLYHRPWNQIGNMTGTYVWLQPVGIKPIATNSSVYGLPCVSG